MAIKKVAIIGAGNGGGTAAADLTSRGFEVRLYGSQNSAKTLEKIKENGGILLKTSEGEEFVTPFMVTTDISEAISGADVIMLTIPSTFIENVAKLCAPHLEEGQIVFINAAASMGSYRFRKTVEEMGITTEFKVGEANTLAYGTRFCPETLVVSLGLSVKKLMFAAHPAEDTQELADSLKKIYPCLVPAKNLFEITLNNGNPESHTGPCVCNSGRIDFSNGEFWLYKEGITEHTVNTVKAVDKERQEICKAMGFEAVSKAERVLELGYAEEKADLQEMYNESKVYGAIKGPTCLDNRYIIEDISDGLVLWSSIGKLVGVKTPVIDSIITLGGVLLERDFWSEGTTLESLGFGGKSLAEILEII